MKEQESTKNQKVALGKDQMSFDQKYWEGEIEGVERLDLPTYAKFEANYPKATNGGAMPGPKVFELIGGEVYRLAQEHNYTNACAARVSRSLVKSGINIPNLNGKTFKGSDGKYHFLGARNLYEWMILTFGEPDLSLTQTQAGNNGVGFVTAAGGSPGIYIMIPVSPNAFGASGHADIFDGLNMNVGGYFSAEGGVHRSCLWKL